MRDFLIKRKPVYKLIKQKPYCCVPACISMILDRRKIKHGLLEEIGYELGLIVPENKTHFFTKIRSGKKPIAGYGTRVDKNKYSINNYFSKHLIDLMETYYPIDKIENVQDFIIRNLGENKDIIACFNFKKLYGKGENFGHVSLIQNVNHNTVTLIDPEMNVPGKRKVKLQKLTKAIECHGKKKRGGLWVISRK